MLNNQNNRKDVKYINMRRRQRESAAPTESRALERTNRAEVINGIDLEK